LWKLGSEVVVEAESEEEEEEATLRAFLVGDEWQSERVVKGPGDFQRVHPRGLNEARCKATPAHLPLSPSLSWRSAWPWHKKMN